MANNEARLGRINEELKKELFKFQKKYKYQE